MLSVLLSGRAGSPVRAFGRRVPRVSLPVGLAAAGGLALWIGVDDASAASVGGAATSVGVVAMLATLLLVKSWQPHLGADGFSALAGLLAFAAGAALVWRSGIRLRGLTSGWRLSRRTRGPVAAVRPPVALPAGIESQALLEELRRHFFDLQAAWDRGARDAMSRMTTPDMLDELCAVSAAAAVPGQRTEFLSVHAELLMFEVRESAQVVCVEYSGMVREASAGSPTPFREFWMWTRAADASAGWRLARHQGLL